jgi:hypothetical protein
LLSLFESKQEVAAMILSSRKTEKFQFQFKFFQLQRRSDKMSSSGGAKDKHRDEKTEGRVREALAENRRREERAGGKRRDALADNKRHEEKGRRSRSKDRRTVESNKRQRHDSRYVPENKRPRKDMPSSVERSTTSIQKNIINNCHTTSTSASKITSGIIFKCVTITNQTKDKFD